MKTILVISSKSKLNKGNISTELKSGNKSYLYGFPSASNTSLTYFRLLEDDEYRILENGDFRILE